MIEIRELGAPAWRTVRFERDSTGTDWIMVSVDAKDRELFAVGTPGPVARAKGGY